MAPINQQDQSATRPQSVAGLPIPYDRPLRLRPLLKYPTVAKQVRKALAQQNAPLPQPTAASDAVYQRIRVGSNGHTRSAQLLLPRTLATNEVAPETKPQVSSEVVTGLPRPPKYRGEAPADWSPPRIKLSATPKVPKWLLLQRLGVWLSILLAWGFGNLWNMLRRSNTQIKRAVRLRHLIEQRGGTLVRVGRQMAVRTDILPLRYCEQLAMMHDQMTPFPLSEAISVIEQSTGVAFPELFATFDPTPISTSSINCTYQAILRATGEKVTVKVQRPGIQEVFEADFKLLVWFAWLMEALTLAPPTYSQSYYSELRKILIDELDFRRCAYYLELFERRARKAKKRFFTAPKVYFDLTSERILVQEFVTGMGLWEVLVALEKGDEASLSYLRELNIDPHKVAQRLLFVQHWAVYEHLNFHADPHLAHIIVGPNSTLFFLDYGASGFIDRPRRDLFALLYASQAKRDVWRMVQAVIALFEPLPARDLNKLAHEIQAAYYEHVLAVKSKTAPWYETTSAALWLATFQVIKKHKIPVPSDVLMYVRATLFYDTVAARLSPTIDYAKAYKHYTKDVEKRARKRGLKWLRRRLRQGLLTGDDLVNLEKLMTTGRDLFSRVQRLLAAPYDFAVFFHIIEKWVVTFTTIFRLILLTILLIGVGVGLIYGSHWRSGKTLTWSQMVLQVLGSRLFQAGFGLLALHHLRTILLRLADEHRKER
jgi:predicted unusual protein kinase regulating ubiquinone biosynthesis (AarF/ABC1/UbiB family)